MANATLQYYKEHRPLTPNVDDGQPQAGSDCAMSLEFLPGCAAAFA